MATIEKQAVRAEVLLGSISAPRLKIETPDVMSFNVKKARGQMSADFSASLKVNYDEFTSSTSLLTEYIVIRAGFKDHLKTIFTGYIYKCMINPVKTDASKVVLSLSGKDVLSILEGQKINRRLKVNREGDEPPERWGVVSSIKKHNTISKQSIPAKTYTNKKLSVLDLITTFVIKAPDAFALENKLKKELLYKVKGTLSVTKGTL